VRAPGGWALLQPVALSGDRVTVVEVYVPDSALTRGVRGAWLILTAVALGLVGGSVLVADRLGMRVVRSARDLARAARALGDGRLDVRVDPQGPTELRDAAAAFNTMADRVEQLLAAEREMAADLSHRLRTPLTALRLNAAQLGDDAVAEQTRHAVDQLEREVDEIIRTARRRPAATGETAGCDAAEVVRARVAFWSALAEDQDRAWQLTGTDRPVRVPVPAADLAAAVDAMLGNVFRHTDEGTPFAVTLHAGKRDVVLLVGDGGPGFADPEAALRRGHGAGGDGSTGLGLDIVRRVAESTGGQVRLERSVLGGAEIGVLLSTGGRGGTERPSRRRVVRRRRRKNPDGAS
jgi:signal transduction histidine kinase